MITISKCLCTKYPYLLKFELKQTERSLTAQELLFESEEAIDLLLPLFLCYPKEPSLLIHSTKIRSDPFREANSGFIKRYTSGYLDDVFTVKKFINKLK